MPTTAAVSYSRARPDATKRVQNFKLSRFSITQLFTSTRNQKLQQRPELHVYSSSGMYKGVFNVALALSVPVLRVLANLQRGDVLSWIVGGIYTPISTEH